MRLTRSITESRLKNGLRRNLAADVVVARVAEHADDRRVGLGSRPLPDHPVERGRPIEVGGGDDLVHERQPLAAAPVAPVEGCTGLDGNAERLEIARSDRVEERERNSSLRDAPSPSIVRAPSVRPPVNSAVRLAPTATTPGTAASPLTNAP